MLRHGNGIGQAWHLSGIAGRAGNDTSDGRFILYHDSDPQTFNDIWVLPLPITGANYDIARDGRILINTVLDDAASPITLIQNCKPPVQ